MALASACRRRELVLNQRAPEDGARREQYKERKWVECEGWVVKETRPLESYWLNDADGEAVYAKWEAVGGGGNMWVTWRLKRTRTRLTLACGGRACHFLRNVDLFRKEIGKPSYCARPLCHETCGPANTCQIEGEMWSGTARS